MANQVTVSNDHSISVTIEPPANVQVLISRAVIGTVANVPSANFANYAGNVTVSAQPNITSLGTLTSLTSNGNIIAPFFIGNIVGNISGNITVPGINTAVLFNQTGNAGASDALTFNYSSNVLTANGNMVANYFIGNGSSLTSIAGANVTGTVANATYATNAGLATFATTANAVAGANVSGQVSYAAVANSVAGANVSGTVANATYATNAGTAYSVAVANVSGIGNIAVLNLDGNLSNILFGNGVFSAVPTVSNVANANYSNFAGTAFSVSASNIVGTVNLANFATTANSVAGANVSGVVANATYATSAGSANTAGTVTTNAQPNITSVGILTGLVVGGDITPNANITYSLGNNTNRFNNLYLAGNTIILGAQTISANATGIAFTGDLSGDASRLSNITGANITGTVANANYSAYSGVAGSANAVAGANVSGAVAYATTANAVAGANVSGAVSFATTANSVAVANVSGIGNIATVNLDGNSSNILYGNGSFAATPIISNVGNANYANFAGQVVDATQSNITTVGTLTTLTVSGNAIITGNLVVNGNTTSVNSNTIYIQDPVIQIGGGANGDPLTINDGRDRGTVLDYFTTAPISAFMGWKNANGRFEFASNVTLANNVVTVNQLANVSADYYIGNGSQLTGITATTGNANYANFAGEAFSVTGSNVSGEVANANYASYAGEAFSVSGANVVGEVANANYANFAGDVVNSSQPNITDVGILTGIYTSGILEFVGNSNAEIQQDFSNGATTITIYGGNHSSLLRLDGLADARVEANANVSINANSQGNNQAWTFDNTGNLTLPGNVFGINYANGTQVTIDNVANANYANFAGEAFSVNVANVSGIGNIATVNLDGNVSNLLTGSGTFVAIPTVSSNANYANFAGEAFSVSAANIVGNVNLANFATTANAVAGANVSGAVSFATTANSVAVANVSGIGNIAVVNLTGSATNVLYGNGVFAAVSGGGGASIANGNSNVNIATSGGNVNVSIGGTADLYSFNNTRFYTELGISSQNNTPNAQSFAIIQGGSGANGLASTVTNQFAQNWNNTSVQFEALRIAVTDYASQANSILFTARTNNVSQFSINKSGNVAFAGVITGNAGGLSNIPVGNLSANVNFANTAGTVTTAAQPNITSVGTLTGLLTSGQIFMSDTSTTPGRFIVTQGGGVGTGMISNLYNVITQKWNNSSVQFTTLEVGATDVTSAANSLLFNATTNAVSKFSINKSGNVVFAGVITGDGGGLSNITAAATSISNGTSNVSIPVSSGNVNISVGAVANVLVTTTTGINVAGTLNATGNANVNNLDTTRVIATGNISGTQLISNIAIGTAPLVVTSTTQVANLNVATAGLATFATTANAVAGANVSGAVSFATTANSVAVANVSGIGNISTINLNSNSSQVLYGNGIFAAVPGGGNGSPGGANTELQFNNNGSFGGISTVTWNGSNISLGAVANVKVTGGSNNEVMRTDGVGNLSFSSIAQTLLVGTRVGAFTVPITNYTFQVTARTGNVTVYVN